MAQQLLIPEKKHLAFVPKLNKQRTTPDLNQPQLNRLFIVLKVLLHKVN